MIEVFELCGSTRPELCERTGLVSVSGSNKIMYNMAEVDVACKKMVEKLYPHPMLSLGLAFYYVAS